MDGFEVPARLRADAATRRLPVVAVSADISLDSQARCRELGCVDYVTKPVDADKLFAALTSALQLAEAVVTTS